MLTGCANAKGPFWLSDVSESDHKRIYGVAKNISTSHLPPLHYAKENALRNWAISAGMPFEPVKTNLAKLDSYELNGKKLYFLASYKEKSGTYVLVSDHNKNVSKRLNNIPNCDIKACEPGWLCSNSGKKISVLGVSAATVHPNDQIANMLENGQQLARMINKAHVQGDIRTLHIANEQMDIANVQERYTIEELSGDLAPVRLNKLCRYKANLIGEVVFETENLFRGHNWTEEPTYKGRLGVVSSGQGFTSTGRISDLIQITARKGLFDMAKAKNIVVENELDLEINNDGYFSLVRKSNQTTESVVSAFIADMKMELNENYQPVINIWLLEKKGEL
jgi:hypothetical protein